MRTALILLALAALLSPGCATSRYDQLRARSKQVERELVNERSAALTAPAPERDARLSRLNGLWASLTAVDIALAATRHAVTASERPVLYDAIEEAYDTISWNAPLPPGTPMRDMPDNFRGGRFGDGAPISD